MKKILIYVDTMNKSGGRERVISNLINHWSVDYDLTLITKDDGKSFYEFPKVNTISLQLPVEYKLKPSRILRMIDSGISLGRSIGRLRRILNKIDYDYLYVSTPQNAFEAYRAMKNPKDQLVVSEHAYAFSFNRIYMDMKKYIYPRSYCISVPNFTDTETYREWGCNAVYVPHMVSFSPREMNSLDTRIAINVGRLTDDKQQAKLIQIWKNVKEKEGWELWIVGDGENRELLRKLINDEKLNNSVKLIPATHSIETIYKKASLFLLSSRWEGFGMVLLEAMAFGIPCISFDCPSGPRDIIKDELNGYLVIANDEKGFSESIQRFICLDEHERIEMGRRAYETVMNWDNGGIESKWHRIFK